MVGFSSKFLSIKEFAKQMGVHHCTIRRAIRDGKIITVRIGRIYRIPFAEIERIVEENLEDKVNRIIEKRNSEWNGFKHYRSSSLL